MPTPNEFEQQVKQFQVAYHSVFNEISKVIVGHAEIVHGVLTCLFCGGHALLEGVPGLRKTLLVRTLSQVLQLLVNYSTREEMGTIIDRTTRNDFPQPDKVMDGVAIQHWQRVSRTVLVAPQVQDYAIRLVLATHPEGPFVAGPTNRLIRCGASP